MRWARVNVNPMLALRTVAANDRWVEAGVALRAHTRAQAAARDAFIHGMHLAAGLAAVAAFALAILAAVALRHLDPAGEPAHAAPAPAFEPLPTDLCGQAAD